MLNYEYDAEAEERAIRREERQTGLQEGKREGRQEKGYEVARNLLDLGISMDVIIKSTGLSVTEILKLQAER